MLNRGHIRVKVMQSIYAMHQNDSDNLEKEEKFLPDDVENNEHGVPIPIGIQSSDGEDLPPLDKVRSTRVIYSSVRY